MFKTKVSNEVGHHINITLFTQFILGVNYLPLKWGSKLTFFVRLFNTIDLEWSILLWSDTKSNTMKVPMYDA